MSEYVAVVNGSFLMRMHADQLLIYVLICQVLK
jgi:hypothetical protein